VRALPRWLAITPANRTRPWVGAGIAHPVDGPAQLRVQPDDGAHATVTPCLRAASMISSASWTVAAIGFSEYTCFPAAIACSVVAACTGVGVRLTTRSTEGSSSIPA
jgi:hypothetical protein